MLSLSKFRYHVYPLFKLMDKANMVLEIVVDGTVYQLHVKRTNKRPTLHRSSNKTKKELQLHQIDAENCELCDGLIISGLCMNTKCPNASGTVERSLPEPQSTPDN